MAVYDRNKGTGKKPNWWMAYAITAELAERHGLKSLTVREPAGVNQRVSESLLAQRRREVRSGTWAPRGQAGDKITLERYGHAWLDRRERAGVKSSRGERQRLADYVFPELGRKALGEVSRADVKRLMAKLNERISERTGKPLAPRTKRHAYADLRTLYFDALADGVVESTPCTLRERREELPKKKDADPRWRAQALFSRAEVEMLISDPRLPDQRRTLYALVLLGGMRIGEAVALTWNDYDAVSKPLGRLRIAVQHDDDDLKGENPREMPVHPTLAAILAQWKLTGFELQHLHRPGPSDLIVPNVQMRKDSKRVLCGKLAWQHLQDDLVMLGLRRRRMHDGRRTFISLALSDGADKYLLKWCTHGRPKGDAFDDYATPRWDALCKQVACLQVSLLNTGKVVRGRFR